MLLMTPEVKLKGEILNSLVSVKQSVASLNRHGNMYEGLFHGATTRPGIIKNIHQPDRANESSAKRKIYNPLNRQGNTFQGLPHGATTRPGSIQNIHQSEGEKNIPAKNPVHFTTNRHGTQFQGFPFNLSKGKLAFPIPEYPTSKIKALSTEKWNSFYTIVFFNED